MNKPCKRVKFLREKNTQSKWYLNVFEHPLLNRKKVKTHTHTHTQFIMALTYTIHTYKIIIIYRDVHWWAGSATDAKVTIENNVMIY